MFNRSAAARIAACIALPFLAALAQAQPGPEQPEPKYRMTILDYEAAGLRSGFVYGIGDSGVVIGMVWSKGPELRHFAYRWTEAGGFILYPASSDSDWNTVAYNIDAAGNVAVGASTKDFSNDSVRIWHADGSTSAAGKGSVLSGNSRGDLLVKPPRGPIELWKDGGAKKLPIPEMAGWRAGINDRRQVTGQTKNFRAGVWSEEVGLQKIARAYSSGAAINNAGEVAGSVINTTGGGGETGWPFIWSEARGREPLDRRANGANFHASDINDAGAIVGNCGTIYYPSTSSGWIWTKDSGMHFLVDLLDPSDLRKDLDLEEPAAINSSWQIAGDGFIGWDPISFLLTPIGEFASSRQRGPAVP